MKTKNIDFIWLTNDLVFKHIFSNEDIAKDYVNSYLSYIGSPLKVKMVKTSKQKYLQGNKLKSRDYYLDILIILSNGEMFNLEMYNNFGSIECKKSLSYASLLYSQQLKKGDSFNLIKKVTSLNIMKGNFQNVNKKLVNIYTISNTINRENLIEESIEMSLIRLDILQKIPYDVNEERYIRWCRFIDAKTKEEALKLAEGDDVFMTTIQMVDEFLSDPEIISAFHTDSWKIESAKEREKIKIAKNMLENKYDVDSICKVTNVSKSQVLELQKSL